MQNRYVADIGDYLKFAILRGLAKDRRVGVAWWLFPDESHNNDGGHDKYLDRAETWRQYDECLFDTLVKLRRTRDVREIEKSDVLAEAVFSADPIPLDCHHKDRPAKRKLWLEQVKVDLKSADVVFVDPDNGIASASCKETHRKAGKSVYLSEIEELARSDRTLIIYHHQTRRKGGHDEERHHLIDRLREREFNVQGVLRAKPWSPRLFFIIGTDLEIKQRAEEIAERWHDLITWHAT